MANLAKKMLFSIYNRSSNIGRKPESASLRYRPILVKNPSTGNLVNVEPLFHLLDLVGEGSMHTIGAELDIAIKYISMSDGSAVSLNKSEILWTLYEIRDAFNNAGS